MEVRPIRELDETIRVARAGGQGRFEDQQVRLEPSDRFLKLARGSVSANDMQLTPAAVVLRLAQYAKALPRPPESTEFLLRQGPLEDCAQCSEQSVAKLRLTVGVPSRSEGAADGDGVGHVDVPKEPVQDFVMGELGTRDGTQLRGFARASRGLNEPS
jgi:hypothetical protein